MTENAIVRKSGQYWKWVLFQCLGVGSALLIFGGGAFRGYGVLLGLFAFIFVNAAIRCPKCGARWFWLAASTKDPRWKRPRELEHCPGCAAQQGAAPERADARPVS
jgi:hypothetical protein